LPRSKTFVPDWPAVLTTAMLSITVSVIHVLDQGGITKYAGSPWWLGWGYRAVEVGGVLTALALAAHRRWMPTWLAAFLVGLGPSTVFLLTRLVGLPGDPGDFGNWGDPLGTASLFVEGTLMLTAVLRHLDQLAAGHRRRGPRWPLSERHRGPLGRSSAPGSLERAGP
jgi:hypothetical protein